jgi:electron transfer flavoprotein alpha subunit
MIGENMVDKIYVLVHHNGDQIHNISYECLALSQKLAGKTGGSVAAVLLGYELEGFAERLGNVAIEEVLVVDDEKLADYRPEGYCEALSQLLSEDKPDLLLVGQVYQNIDLVPKLAARLKSGLVTDCIDVRLEDGDLLFTRQMFRNKLNADLCIHEGQPMIASIQAGAYLADQLAIGTASVVPRDVDLGSVEFQRKTLETLEMTKQKVDLSQAEVIVGIGRGVKQQENMAIIEELAQALGAEIGASRPVVDNEWLERDRQIGSSGQTVSPKLYIAAGISGAIQHVVGIKNSGCIVAINSDPNAPIFNVATYGIVGDLIEILPILARRLREG